MTGDRMTAAALGLTMFVIFNANGREIGSYDSQPTKYAARELLLRGTLSLNHVVGRTPGFMERSAFVVARDGRYRSAYSPVPAIAAAAIAWPLVKTGLVDIKAPLAPALIAKISSSFLVAVAVMLAFLTARRITSRPRALFVALSFGIGTGLWSTASQTLWQHEVTIFGLMLAIYGLSAVQQSTAQAVTIGAGLGLAAASRMQVAPAVIVVLAGLTLIAGWRAATIAVILTAALVIPVIVVNVQWFGSPLGAAPMLEALHGSVHGTTGTFRWQLAGFQGLLISPSRGLLVFSPVVVFVVFAARSLVRSGWRAPAAWGVTAAAAQFVLYGSYTVWWGGHTYGPRYMLDLLPLLVPAGAAAADALRRPAYSVLATMALTWSVATSALGAFCYPHDRWNSDPADIDRNHKRLWEWSDTQIARAWQAGASPQNFTLLTRDAVRAPRP